MMSLEDMLEGRGLNYRGDVSVWSNITISDPRIGCSTHTAPPAKMMPAIPRIDHVIFNPPCTIILWDDGTKTIVKTHEEEFSEEHGFGMAMIKKQFGSRSAYLKILKKADRQPKVKKEKKAK
jgi:hypothetical protein